MMKKKQLRTVILHVLILCTIIGIEGIYFINAKGRYIEEVNQQTLGLTSIVASVGNKELYLDQVNALGRGEVISSDTPAFKQVIENLSSSLEREGLLDAEISLITKHPVTGEFIRILSSDPLFGNGRAVNDRSGYLAEHYTEEASELIEVNDEIKKFVAHSPIMSTRGTQIGIIRLQTGDRSSELENSYNSAWLFKWLLAYAVISAVYYLVLRQKQSHSINSGNSAIYEELKKKNEDLRMLSLVTKQSDNLMLITDDQGYILWVNETYQEKNNYTAEELNNFVGSYLPKISQNPNIRTIIKNVVDFQDPIKYESSSHDSAGERYYAITTVTPILDDDGQTRNLLFVDTDVTTMKQAEILYTNYKEMVDQCKLPMIQVNGDGTLGHANKAAADLVACVFNQSGTLKPDYLDASKTVMTKRAALSREVSIEGRHEHIRISTTKHGESIIIMTEPKPESRLTKVETETSRKAG